MASTTQIWKHTAVAFQEEMCYNLSDVDWDAYEEGETIVLKNKIRMLLFGLSSTGNEEVERHVDKMCEVIIKESMCKFEDANKIVCMVFIFVVGTKDGENIESWPVFKVPKDDTGINASFIDISCRVYGNWKDFLESNKLPVHEYCYPKDGKYKYNSYGNAAIEFGQSPETKTSKKVQNALDVVSTGVGLGATALTIASLAFPVVAPFVAASAWAAGGVSVYSTYRSSTKLYDRKKHKQDIGFRDKEARSCYITIAGSALGLGATAATSATVHMAQSGQMLGKTTTSAVTVLNGGALVINGVGIANGLHQLIEKHKEGQLSTLDVAQFSACLLLFCHATVNFKTARSIIEQSQDNVIKNYGNSLGSKWKRVMFRASVKCATKLRGPVGGKALIIRNIKHISTADEYFASLLPEGEAVNQNHAVLLSLSNITQTHGFEHLESLLNEYEKFTLRRLLMRFTEPIRKVILKLCDSLYQIMGKARGLDLMHIVSFVSEFVRYLINFIYNGEKLFVLSLLQYAIHEKPFDGMSCSQFCLALFEEFLFRPDALIKIYNLIQSFFAVSSERTQMSWQLQNVDFIQLVSVCSVLLKTDKLHWEMIIDFAKNIFDTLNLKKFSSLVRILKELLLYIQERILAVQRRYETHRHESRGIEQVALNSYDRQIRSESVSALESLYDEEFSTSFANRLQGLNLDEGPEERIPLRPVVSPYTMDNPLSFQKHFWNREQLELLTEKEILEICKNTLRMDDLPKKYFIMYDGLESFVTIGDTVVVIRCDLHKETVESYAVLPVSTFVQNDDP